MLKLKNCLLGLLVLALSALPVMAGDSDKKTENDNTANTASSVANSTAPALSTGDASVKALLGLLVSKGVLNAEEARTLNGTPAQQNARLLDLLRQKGILSADDYAALSAPSASAQVALNLVASTSPIIPSVLASTPNPEPQSAKPVPPKVIPAVAPLRVLQLEPSKPDGMIPDLKLGSGARLKIYGMVKTSVIYDTSSPYGTDMPLPGFITASGTGFDPGPNSSPEFHAKARFARVGTNFEWPDVGGNNAITGKLEFDFEGNFSRTLNRNISTIRSSMASIRLAYGRIDHKFNDQTSMFALFGQDWTPFGSSTLPNLFETTGLGLGFGTLYERAPQFRFGIGHKIGGSRNVFFQPEFAIVMPAYGNDPSNVADQLGYGEKQGADSGRPEVQARIVTQWQLDRAPGVAPAQLIFSGVQGNRKVMVRSTDVPLCNNPNLAVCPTTTIFRAEFPHGLETTSNRAGWTGELQLPTRWVTVTTKYWSGSDLRFYFVGGLFSNYSDTAGLTKTCLNAEQAAAFCTGPSNDGGSTVTFATNADGTATFAPQRPVRASGAFINVAFPLSRIFNADPSGRNAGWQLHLHYAFDQAKTRDVLSASGHPRLGNPRSKDDLAAATLYWKMNNLVSFALEESMYRTRIANPNLADSATFPIYRGVPARQWHDIRSEFGPIFTF
jgi:hypothetical protein